MEPTIRRIALFAYVIGGWLMPAAHHHVHASTGDGPACGSHSAIHSHADHCHSHDSSSGCEGHQHSAEAAGGESVADSTAFPPGEISGDQVSRCDQSGSDGAVSHAHHFGDDCGGLCALCSARSLTVCRVAEAECAAREPAPCDLADAGSQLLPPGAVLRPRFCRGPPCVA